MGNGTPHVLPTRDTLTSSNPSAMTFENLVAPDFRLDEVRVLIDVLFQRAGELGKCEEVVFFLEPLGLLLVSGAEPSLFEVLLLDKFLAGSAVVTLVGSLVDVAVLMNDLEEPLDPRLWTAVSVRMNWSYDRWSFAHTFSNSAAISAE